jgi:hypothetical protein
LSADLEKKFEIALAKIASLEAKLNAKPTPQPQGLDPAKLREQMINDPFGTLTKLGVPTQHITRHAVAHELRSSGLEVPAQLEALISVGPQINATNALESKFEQLSRQVSEIVNTSKARTVQERFSALAADKKAYPHLAKAYAANPEFFAKDLERPEVDAEALAKELEAQHAMIASVYGYKPETSTASDVNAGNTVSTQSTQGMPAPVAGNLNSEMPPVSQSKAGLWTQEDHDRIRDEIVRKYASP